MKSQKTLFTIIGIVILVVLIFISIQYLLPQNSSFIELNEDHFECYEGAKSAISSFYNTAKIPINDAFTIGKVRCSFNKFGSVQLEIIGMYYRYFAKYD